jgi:hypothetical protein
VADVDDDAIAELVQGHGVWQWDASARQWVDEAWSPAAATAGHVAIADFGDYPGTHGWPADAPEVVVVRSGTVRVQTLDGEVQVGPIAIPGGGNGGPPTIADFDGDGRPEFATAAAHSYTVYDLDCSPSPVGTCASGGTDCVLWSQPNQDLSSNVTGSSVFDFEGDGRAEVVYGDECFARVYDGPSGAVLFSQYRSSCTWYENPVIADVDGDYNAEIVVGHNYNCGSADSGIACGGLGPRNTDPIFPGVRCASGDDCVSGTCDEGLCRCAGDAECCTGAGCERAGLVCETPPAGTPGTGNTCRAGRPRGALGITVYGDRADRWVRSRSIWNQHPYHVTNVREDATIPATSEVEANWKTPGLNNFRQNVQGDVHPGAAPDLTGRWSTTIVCWGSPPAVTLEVAVCNRGAEPVAADVPVGFYEGDPDAGGTRLCLVRTAERLAPRRCTTVYCEWAAPPAAAPGTDVHVVVDDGGEVGECREGNNRFVFEDVFCPGP